MQPCSDNACAQDCFDNGTTSAQQQYDAVMSCASAHNCQDNSCINTNCQTQIDACQGGSNPTGPKTCGDLITCMSDCADSTCEQSCYTTAPASAQQAQSGGAGTKRVAGAPGSRPRASGEAVPGARGLEPGVFAILRKTSPRRDYSAVSSCFQQNNCEDAACLESKCATQLSACVNGTSTTGPATCAEVNSCISNCNGDATCAQSCLSSATSKAQQDFQALKTCVQGHSCGGTTSCWKQYCSSEAAACGVSL